MDDALGRNEKNKRAYLGWMRLFDLMAHQHLETITLADMSR